MDALETDLVKLEISKIDYIECEDWWSSSKTDVDFKYNCDEQWISTI